MYLIDTHAHIYLPDFTDLDMIMEKALAEGVEKIYMPAIDSHTHNAMLLLEKQNSRCIPMMGLHPCSVNDTVDKELEIVEGWLKQRWFAAVGEIGLDFYWDKTFSKQQYEAFHKQIEWSLNFDLPIVIHSRNATRECIDVVKQYPKARGVFHCFSGNVDEAGEIIELGLFLGIGGVVTFKNGGLDKVIKETGIDKVVLETDAPYLAPVPYRGKRNEPSYLKYVVTKISEVLGIEEEEVARVTTGNARQLFGG